MAELTYPEVAGPFVDGFFAQGAPRSAAFVAPPGFGGASILLAMVSRAVRPNGRALVMLPSRALQQQAADRLRTLAPQATVHVMDTAKFREESSADEGAFAQPGIYVASLRLIADAALDALLSKEWDIVALDAAGGEVGPTRVLAVDDLIACSRVDRILIRFDVLERAKQVAGTRMAEVPIVWQVGVPPTQQFRTKVVEFQRVQKELDLLLGVLAIMGSGFQGSPVLRAALSCPAALEATLTAWRNKMVHAVSPLGEESIETDPGLTPIALAQVGHIFAQLDELGVDSKLDALLSSLGALSEIDHVVVFTVFVATAQYLQGALAARGCITFRVSGDMSDRDREDGLAEFRTYGGVLIVTVAALRGVELGLIDKAIHYDLPASSAEYSIRMSRLRGAETAETLDSVLLFDASSVARRLQPEITTLLTPSATDPKT